MTEDRGESAETPSSRSTSSIAGRCTHGLLHQLGKQNRHVLPCSAPAPKSKESTNHPANTEPSAQTDHETRPGTPATRCARIRLACLTEDRGESAETPSSRPTSSIAGRCTHGLLHQLGKRIDTSSLVAHRLRKARNHESSGKHGTLSPNRGLGTPNPRANPPKMPDRQLSVREKSTTSALRESPREVRNN